MCNSSSRIYYLCNKQINVCMPTDCEKERSGVAAFRAGELRQDDHGIECGFGSGSTNFPQC